MISGHHLVEIKRVLALSTPCRLMRRAQEISSEIVSKAAVEGPTPEAAAADLMLPSHVAKKGGMGVNHPGGAADHLHRGAKLTGAEVEAADVDAGGVGEALEQIKFRIGRHEFSVVHLEGAEQPAADPARPPDWGCRYSRSAHRRR